MSGWSWKHNPVTQVADDVQHPLDSGFGLPGYDPVVGNPLQGHDAGGIGASLFGRKNGHSGQWDLLNNAGAAGPAGPLSREQVIMNTLNEQLAIIKKRQNNTQLGTTTTGDQTPTLASSVLFGAGEGNG